MATSKFNATSLFTAIAVVLMIWFSTTDFFSGNKSNNNTTSKTQQNSHTNQPVKPKSSDKRNNNSPTLTDNKGGTAPNTQPEANPARSAYSEVLNQMLSHKIIYTKHALCRMDCRYISENEVRDILKRGIVNARKSQPAASPCPSYALEGDTKDGQHVRIVFAACDNSTKVITTIDLDKKYNCHCD